MKPFARPSSKEEQKVGRVIVRKLSPSSLVRNVTLSMSRKGLAPHLVPQSCRTKQVICSRLFIVTSKRLTISGLLNPFYQQLGLSVTGDKRSNPGSSIACVHKQISKAVPDFLRMRAESQLRVINHEVHRRSFQRVDTRVHRIGDEFGFGDLHQKSITFSNLARDCHVEKIRR